MSMEDLVAVEERIKGAFVEQAIAFKEIADDGLYKSAGFKSFDDYCNERANCGARHGWQMVKAGEIVQKLLDAPIGQLWLPANERQAREFARLKPPRDSDQAPDVANAAQIVYDYAPKKNGEPVITADSIRDTLVAKKVIPPPKKVDDKQKQHRDEQRQLKAILRLWEAFRELELTPDEAVEKFGDSLFTEAYENAVADVMRYEELRNG